MRIEPTRPMMGARPRNRWTRRVRCRDTGSCIDTDARRASVEQSAERIDGIARMVSTSQLMNTPVQNLPLETPPPRLTRCVGLIGFERAVGLICVEPGQQR